METIRNYLENMFANLPNSAEVKRAKDELLQMMEDKYNELIEEGKSENEAVGCVISEFGNLDELAEVLGLEQEINDEKQWCAASNRRQVTFEEVKDYLHDSAKQAFYIAAGVALCIMSVCWPVLCDAVRVMPESLGVLMMFVMVAVAVMFFILGGEVISKRWSYLKKELCSIDYATATFVHQEKERFRGSYIVQMSVGIVLCITCWLPSALFDEIQTGRGVLYGSLLETIGAEFLFIICAIGVFLIIHGNMINSSYEELLKINNKDTVGGNFVEDGVSRYAGPVSEGFMSVYWPTIRSLYLIWSFLTFAWYKTWIIWPVAAILHGILEGVLKKKEE